MPPRCSTLSARPGSRRSQPAGRTVDELLSRRVVFVAGKGGTGKSSIAAALALVAAHEGKRVLGVDVDGKGDLAAALGSREARFTPTLVQPRLSVLSLRPEESFQEYLRIYFKVPRFARLTPMARVFDFIATAVPGPRDMLVVGKIAYEERRREGNGRAAWDLIVVDSAASGHVVSHLAAARSMLTLVRGGIIRSQVEWIDALVRDSRRTTVAVCALPEEMPVVEAVELSHRLREEAGVSVDACFLNRVVVDGVSPAQRALVQRMTRPENLEMVERRLGGSPVALADALQLAERLHDAGVVAARRLRTALAVPLLTVPLLRARPGLATARAIAERLQAA
jgi:anion-transporting  ArsA/GET3 family ATPase